MNNMIREVDREPKCPDLTGEQIEIITHICFRENDPIQEADCLFVFGTYKYLDSLGSKIREILNSGKIKKVILTGGISKFEDSSPINSSEANLILQAIGPSEYPNIMFILEEKSENSLENVQFGLEIASENGIIPESIMFLFKARTAGRGHATLKKFLPHAKILQQTHEPKNSPGDEVTTKENWFKTELGRNRVWGEILRLRKYGEREDIDISEIKDQLDLLPNVN